MQSRNACPLDEVSRPSRCWAKRWSAWALCLVLAASAGAQPAPPAAAEPSAETLRRWSELTRRYGEQIERETALGGPYSESLLELLLPLAMLYRERGDHDLAAQTLETALQVKRVNEGLRSLDQAPLIELLLDSEIARGNIDAAVGYERALVRLARLNPDDLRSVPILRESGDREIGIYTRYLEGALPPEVNVRFDPAGAGPGPGLRGNRAIGVSSLQQARRNYREAIGVLMRNGRSTSDEVLELEERLIVSYFLEATSDEALPLEAEYAYQQGRDAYQRIVARSTSGTVAEFATALIRYADWELFFSHNGAALNAYRLAYELLASRDEASDLIDELFAPDTPIVLPAFLPNPLAADDAGATAGYVDLTFELNRYGTARRIEVLAADPGIADAAERRIVRIVARSVFRPRITDGEFARRTPILLSQRVAASSATH